MTLEKQIAEDYGMVLKEAQSMGCNKINALYNIPLDNMKAIVNALEEVQKYRAIGTPDECRAAVEKQKPKKPIYKHYEDEDKGEPPYIKIACPNGCRIQLYPVTDKNLAHEHVYCPKCGQKLDWGGEE